MTFQSRAQAVSGDSSTIIRDVFNAFDENWTPETVNLHAHRSMGGPAIWLGLGRRQRALDDVRPNVPSP